MSIQDAIFAVEGLQVNEGMAAHFARTATESLQDAELRWLNETVVGGPVLSIADGWHALGAEQFAGLNHINDIKLAYWLSKV